MDQANSDAVVLGAALRVPDEDGLPGGADLLAGGRRQAAGGFRFWLADQRWEWSDEVAAMHGYAEGTVQATTELLLSHKHPEDRDQVAATIARTVDTGEPFCSSHRIVDRAGAVRHVLVVGDYMIGDDGAVLGTSGYYIDVTDTFAESRKATLDGVLPELYESRAAIEQVKGAMMLVYGISADQAFRVLAWRSQETNVKLRTLAARLIAELTATADADVQLRTRFDHLLLTVHERAGDDGHPEP
ncbi:PAS and ANTAR domain-containing protein [Nocardia harenae]|uniref:PAS and ANTAR domain-containing protein n=1 Tax=Nocardia harenae TaxID=358707 RepID=UPI000A04E624|nr:PAS and ANTAR domain-containing protein [Nocardia harenae]